MPSNNNVDHFDLVKRWEGLNFGLLRIDELDIKILNLLIKNCRYSNIKIAKMLNSSEATIRRRIRRLEKQKIIQRYEAHINFATVENPVKAYYSFNVQKEYRARILRRLCQNPRSLVVYATGGEFQCLFVMLFTNIEEYQQFTDRFLKYKGIKDTNVQVVVESLKGDIWSRT